MTSRSTLCPMQILHPHAAGDTRRCGLRLRVFDGQAVCDANHRWVECYCENITGTCRGWKVAPS